MASLSEAKSLGGIGAILAFFPALNVVGWLLILLAIKNVSEVLQDRTIFDDAIIAAATSVISSIAFGILLFAGYFLALFALVPSPRPAVIFWAIILLLIAWVFGIISAVFLKRSYDKIGHRLSVGAFATTGILYLVGSLLTVILIGVLIVFIALIFQVVAYFSIRDQPYPAMGLSQASLSPVSPLPPPVPHSVTSVQSPSEFKYCFNCGSRLSSTAVFCSNCGKKQP